MQVVVQENHFTDVKTEATSQLDQDTNCQKIENTANCNADETTAKQVATLNDKLCEIEAVILRSNEIIDCNETDKIERPVCEFTITEDDLVPELLFRKFARNLEKIQSLASKYLKSNTPAPQLRVSHKPPIPRRARST